jgi:hypothetical protein
VVWSQPQIPPKGPPAPEQKTAESAQHKNKTSKHQEPRSEPAPSLQEAVGPSADQNGTQPQTTQELEVNRRLAEYTGQLARFTMWLVIMGGLQFAALVIQAIVLRHHGILIGRSVQQMRRAVRAYRGFVQASKSMLAEAQRSNAEHERLITESNQLTRDSVEEAQRSNVAHEALAKESNELTRDSNTQTQQSVALAKRTLALTQRPRLIVRNVELDEMGSLLEGEPVDVAGTLQIYNGGGSKARVAVIACKLFAFDKLPTKVPFESSDFQSLDIELAPGIYETRSFGFGASGYKTFAGIVGKTTGLYLMGEMVYSDDSGLRRTKRFCRLFDWEKERFLPVTDSDYETDE